jgi:hypothetical protein
MQYGIPQDLKLSAYHMVGMNKDTIEQILPDIRRSQIDRMYYNIILARDSITIRSSSNVRIVRKEDKK